MLYLNHQLGPRLSASALRAHAAREKDKRYVKNCWNVDARAFPERRGEGEPGGTEQREELNPETQLKQIEFEYILCCHVRLKRALNEEFRWGYSSGAENTAPSAGAAPVENNTPSNGE